MRGFARQLRPAGYHKKEVEDAGADRRTTRATGWRSLRPIPLLAPLLSPRQPRASSNRIQALTALANPARPMAEDRGFEPLRAINPTRVPGERHRPLGESSVAMVAAGPRRPARGRGGPRRTRDYTRPRTPRGVSSVNSPRAGRQQGSMGSVGCAGSPMSGPVSPVPPAFDSERAPKKMVAFDSLSPEDLAALHTSPPAGLRGAAGQEAGFGPDPRQTVRATTRPVQPTTAACPRRNTATPRAPTRNYGGLHGLPGLRAISPNCSAFQCRT